MRPLAKVTNHGDTQLYCRWPAHKMTTTDYTHNDTHAQALDVQTLTTMHTYNTHTTVHKFYLSLFFSAFLCGLAHKDIWNQNDGNYYN